MSWREWAPEPFALWARFTPRRWPPADGVHADPIARGLSPVDAEVAGELPGDEPPEPEVIYLPPVSALLCARRDALAARLLATGSHPLVHRRLDERSESPRGEGGTPVVDLLAALVGLAAADELPPLAGSWVVFPLLPGISDRAERWLPWLDRLAASGARVVVGVVLELSPSDRRRLAELGGEESWSALFHGAPPSERDFARDVARLGLATLPERPAIGAAPRRLRNRALAALLAEAGELGLRLGGSESEGEALRAAARHLDASALDVAALAREGNLEILPWLSSQAQAIVLEAVTTGSSRELARRRMEWSGGAEG